MERERLAQLRFAAVLGDAAALTAAWTAVVYLRGSFHSWWPFDVIGGQTVMHTVSVDTALPLGWIAVPVWMLVLYERGSYSALRRKGSGQAIRELALSIAVALVAVQALFFALKLAPVSRTLVAGFALASLPTLAVSRWLHLAVLRRLRRGRFDPHRVLVLGEPGPYADVLREHDEWGITMVTGVPVGELESALAAQAIDEVYLAGEQLDPETLKRVADACDVQGVPLSVDANFLGLRTSRADLVEYGGYNVLTFTSTPRSPADLVLKRAIDVVGAAVCLAVLAPVMAVIAVAIRRSDGGPVLFVQERVGRHGRPFRMLKFRSMVPDAPDRLADLRAQNEMSGPVFKMRDDPRITTIGRWLRRHSLDELPQLINVLRGDMSLVGPRPPVPEEVASYERWQLRRLSMKPGITCSWQVSGRSDVDFDRWMALDLEYIDNWTLWLDLRLLAQTVPVVLLGTGAR